MFKPAREETHSRYDEVVLAVLVYCEEHLEEPLTLEDLAAVAGFSPHHFHRVFQHVTGETPKGHLRRLRLERAVYRMKTSPDNVLRIALDSGFATHETFTRAFVRRFDISPSEFRAVLMNYRASVDDVLGNRTFAGFTEETPLTLRFDLQKEPVTVKRTPGRHLLFVRHYGLESLVPPGGSFLDLWDELFSYLQEHRIAHASDVLLGITHDDPYVTDEPHIRFDACIEISEPVATSFPVAYRYQPARLCVTRRHDGGLQEIAKTFAQIGVDWLPSSPYGMAAASPFELYHCTRTADGELHVQYADAFVPLDTTEGEA
ncbi:AraC family transcriptional regulator [Microbacterium sp. DT81.1]|uniref:AraC family transcriptional regulator n=1 Tax=Microbacterium sp. DT81.1 TaxID=3393413 RepID=UPI003CF85455